MTEHEKQSLGLPEGAIAEGLVPFEGIARRFSSPLRADPALADGNVW